MLSDECVVGEPGIRRHHAIQFVGLPGTECLARIERPDAAPRAMRELIKSGMLVPPDPMTMLHEPTMHDDANDAALRVAVIEALLETSQLSLDDALHSLRSWRALRDDVTQP